MILNLNRATMWRQLHRNAHKIWCPNSKKNEIVITGKQYYTNGLWNIPLKTDQSNPQPSSLNPNQQIENGIIQYDKKKRTCALFSCVRLLPHQINLYQRNQPWAFPCMVRPIRGTHNQTLYNITVYSKRATVSRKK